MPPYYSLKYDGMFFKHYARIYNRSYWLNGTNLPEWEGLSVAEVFAAMHGDYPRFSDMDDFSRLGFVASEIVLADAHMDRRVRKPNMGIALISRSGCLASDVSYYQFLSQHPEERPAPELFHRIVPTSVCTDIAIRNQITGELALLTMDGFSPSDIFSMVLGSFLGNEALEHLLFGYVDAMGGTESALLILMSRGDFDEMMRKDLVEETFYNQLETAYSF